RVAGRTEPGQSGPKQPNPTDHHSELAEHPEPERFTPADGPHLSPRVVVQAPAPLVVVGAIDLPAGVSLIEHLPCPTATRRARVVPLAAADQQPDQDRAQHHQAHNQQCQEEPAPDHAPRSHVIPVPRHHAPLSLWLTRTTRRPASTRRLLPLGTSDCIGTRYPASSSDTRNN